MCSTCLYTSSLAYRGLTSQAEGAEKAWGSLDLQLGPGISRNRPLSDLEHLWEMVLQVSSLAGACIVPVEDSICLLGKVSP